MDRPLDIAFHNTEPSEQVEAKIRRHVDTSLMGLQCNEARRRRPLEETGDAGPVATKVRVTQG